MTEKVKSGDSIRVTEDGLLGARVLAGDVLEVIGRLSGTVFITESPRAPWANGWWLPDTQEGEGWERVDS